MVSGADRSGVRPRRFAKSSNLAAARVAPVASLRVAQDCFTSLRVAKGCFTNLRVAKTVSDHRRRVPFGAR